MTALGVRPGLLRATSGTPMDRLSFVADDGEVYFDAPIAELHSVGLAEMNRTLEVWEGDKRHRVSLAPEGVLMGNIVGSFSRRASQPSGTTIYNHSLGRRHLASMSRSPESRRQYRTRVCDRFRRPGPRHSGCGPACVRRTPAGVPTSGVARSGSPAPRTGRSLCRGFSMVTAQIR